MQHARTKKTNWGFATDLYAPSGIDLHVFICTCPCMAFHCVPICSVVSREYKTHVLGNRGTYGTYLSVHTPAARSGTD